MLNTILLQAQQQQQGSAWGMILPMVLIIAVFYLFMIRPQSKKQKELQKQRDAMKAGDKVVTAGGIYGKVKEVKDNVVVVEVADNVRLRIDKNSVYMSAQDAQQSAQPVEGK